MRGNSWMDHVKQIKLANPGKSLKEILKLASKTYKKVASVGTKKRKRKRKSSSSKRKSSKRKSRKRKSGKRKSGKRRSRRRRSRRR